MTTFDELGARTYARFDELAVFSDEPEWLTRAYGGAALRAAQERVAGWMQAAGMSTWRDAVGNLIGRYEGTEAAAPMLVYGGHLDTVRNAGKYDGTLGVLAGLAVVEHLAAEGRRLPFAIQVVAFADEESYRFPTMYLGSTVWTGDFDAALLAGKDAAGVPLAEAVESFGGDLAALRDTLPRPAETRAFVELHIEQGPVLEATDAPAGIVSAIAGASRFTVEVPGVAGHAGTVPMSHRRDALVTAAECVLAINRVGRDTDGLVATVGSLSVEPNARNVIPGRVTFSIDMRHADDRVREAAVARTLAAIAGIGEALGSEVTVTPIPGADATPMDPAINALWEELFTAQGIEPRFLASGAGHDAVAVSAIAPVSMLFLRCRGGVSHHPDEFITAEDTTVGIRLLAALAERLASGG